MGRARAEGRRSRSSISSSSTATTRAGRSPPAGWNPRLQGPVAAVRPIRRAGAHESSSKSNWRAFREVCDSDGIRWSRLDGANRCSIGSEHGGRALPPTLPSTLPRRDDEARARLYAAAARAAPAVLAGDRLLTVAGPLGRAAPGGRTPARQHGRASTGRRVRGRRPSRSLLAAAATSAGEWAAVVDPDGTLGRARRGRSRRRARTVRGRAAGAGRPVGDGGRRLARRGRAWSSPRCRRAVRLGDARRLAARARERARCSSRSAPWPAEASVRVHTRRERVAGSRRRRRPARARAT